MNAAERKFVIQQLREDDFGDEYLNAIFSEYDAGEREVFILERVNEACPEDFEKVMRGILCEEDRALLQERLLTVRRWQKMRENAGAPMVKDAKPDWSDAPEWANYLAQDESGAWYWYDTRPSQLNHGFSPSGRGKTATLPNWRETLESRPQEALGKVTISGQLQAIDRDRHFSEMQTTVQDRRAGNWMAHEIGDTYIENQSPVEQWTQIMKALRIHGFQISFDKMPDSIGDLANHNRRLEALEQRVADLAGELRVRIENLVERAVTRGLASRYEIEQENRDTGNET